MYLDIPLLPNAKCSVGSKARWGLVSASQRAHTASIDRIDRLTCFQRMLGEKGLDAFAVNSSIDQRIVDTAPATLKAGSQAQVRRREHRASREQRIGEIEERIAPSREELVHLLTKGQQRFEG